MAIQAVLQYATIRYKKQCPAEFLSPGGMVERRYAPTSSKKDSQKIPMV